MLKRVLFFLCTAALAFGADEWAKVKALKTGAELHVYKRGVAQPLTVQMDELTDDNLMVIDKKHQTAIPRDQIDRIDARPSDKRPMTRQTTTTTEKNAATDPRSTIPGPNAPPGTGGAPSTSTSSGISFGSKPGFEIVYQRPAGAPKK